MKEATEYARTMLFALKDTGKHVYAGTVPEHVIERRRTRNKAARLSRRINRGQR